MLHCNMGLDGAVVNAWSRVNEHVAGEDEDGERMGVGEGPWDGEATKAWDQ